MKKKIVISLPKGFKYTVHDTDDTLEIIIEPKLIKTIKTAVSKRSVAHAVAKASASGEIVSGKLKSARSKTKKRKHHGTGGTGPRRK